MYPMETSDVFYDGCYHIYYDHWISQVWNGMHAARIMLNESIWRKLLEAIPSAFLSTQFQTSTTTILQMRDDILRSVPQHLGYVHRKPFTEENAFAPPPLRRHPNHPIVAAYYLIWPLYVTGIMCTSALCVREFASRSLKFIGEEMGIRQASNLGQFLMETSGDGEEMHQLKRLGVRWGGAPIRPLQEMLRREAGDRQREIGRGVEV